MLTCRKKKMSAKKRKEKQSKMSEKAKGTLSVITTQNVSSSITLYTMLMWWKICNMKRWRKKRTQNREEKKIKVNSNTNLIGSKQKPGKGKKKVFLISAPNTASLSLSPLSCSSLVVVERFLSLSAFSRIYSSRAAIYCCCAVANCPGVLLYLSPPNDSFHEEEAPRSKKKSERTESKRRIEQQQQQQHWAAEKNGNQWND